MIIVLVQGIKYRLMPRISEPVTPATVQYYVTFKINMYSTEENMS